MSLAAADRDLGLSGGGVPAGLTVALGAAPAPAAVVPVVRFAAGAVADGELLVAPAPADGAWRVAPRPAADALFALAPGDPRRVLLVGDRPGLADKLRERGLGVRCEPQLTAAALEACGGVFLDGAEEAFCALAAQRLVVLRAPAPAFGLQDGIDCFFAADDDEAAAVFDAAAQAPQAFAPIAATGRFAAEAHRASDVYARLALDLVGDATISRSADST